MDTKKLMLIVSSVLAVLFFFLFILYMDSARRAQEDLRRAQDDKTALANEIEPLRGQRKQYEEKINRLQVQVDQLNGDKQRLQEQMNGVGREKEELNNEINRLNGELNRARREVDQVRQQAQQSQQVQQAPVRESLAPTMVRQETNSNEYWASVLRQKAALELKLEELDKKYSEAKLAAEKLRQEKTAIEQEVSTLTRENSDVKRELEYNKKLLDSFTVDLAMEKNNNYDIKNSLASLVKENKELKTKLVFIAERKEALEVSLSELKAKNQELEDSLEKMQIFVKSKLRQVDELKSEFSSIKPEAVKEAVKQEKAAAQRKESVDLPTIVIRPDGKKETVAAIASQAETIKKAANIIAVNKDSNFVIMNQGSNQGIKTGDSFKVFDADNRPAGEIEVIQVRDNIAAADIKKEMQPLRVGFTVR